MKIKKDKLMHFGVCSVIAFALGLSGVMLAIGLSIGKEYGDKSATGNHWCWCDLLADAVGMITGYVLRLICF